MADVNRMRIVTINIPDIYIDTIEIFVKQGYFPSRSETIREALKRFLIRDPRFMDLLEDKEKIERFIQNIVEPYQKNHINRE